jgi:hypothetical protein
MWRRPAENLEHFGAGYRHYQRLLLNLLKRDKPISPPGPTRQTPKIMTRQPYTPDRLDQLALRVLDVCGRLRSMALRVRGESVDEFLLHDKKALEWLAHLEEWAQKSEADVELVLLRQRGTRRAGEAVSRQQ